MRTLKSDSGISIERRCCNGTVLVVSDSWDMRSLLAQLLAATLLHLWELTVMFRQLDLFGGECQED